MTPSRRARPALDIWETEYLQILEGADPVKEWTKGTWLKPLLVRPGGAGAEPLRGALRGAGGHTHTHTHTRRGRTGGRCFPSGASSSWRGPMARRARTGVSTW